MPTATAHSSTQRARRRFRALALGAAIVFTILLIGYFIVAPLIVRRMIHQALHDIGEDSASFDLTSLSFSKATVRHVALGAPQWLNAATIEIRYSPLTLMRGRVKSIDVDGVEWIIRVRDGEIDLGFPTLDSSSGASSGDLPFDRLTVKKGRIELEVDGQLQHVTAAGSINRSGVGRMDGCFTISAPALTWGGVELALPDAIANFAMASLADGGRTIDGSVTIANAALAAPQYQLAIAEIAATIPISMHGAVTESGSIALDGITWRNTSLAGIAGSLSVTDGRIRTALQWPVFPGARVALDGWLELGESGPRGRLAAVVEEFVLTDASLIQSLAPALRDVNVGGTYAVDALAEFADGQFKPRVTVSGRQATLSGEHWPGSIDDAEATITITGLDPLTTEPDQTIFVNRARIGDTTITNGALAFTVESIDRVRIPHVSWNMAGRSQLGRFTLDPIVVNPAEPRFDSTLRCEDVELGAWLELLSSGRVTGQGRLEGLIAFDFDPQRKQAVVLGNGVLEAKPGNGSVQIRDQKALDLVMAQVQAAPGSVLQQVRDQVQDQLRQRIMLALSDFEYSSLAAELTPEGNDLVCELRAAGRGRIGPDPQEFASIAVNVHQFNAAVRAALITQDISSRME